MNNDSVSEIKERLDIVEFISQYLPLKKAGVNYQGLCPFHDEKTPSFSVSPERQSFKCFGCGRGGDVFTFVMEKEGLEFREALEMLAQKTGVKLEPRLAGATSNRPQKQSLFALNEQLANFWHQLLLKHEKAENARTYLKQKRGLSDNIIEQFQIGLAPANRASYDFLKKRGFSDSDIKLAGEPARFAGRIIFPIADITGRITGFTGRLQPQAEADLKGPAGPKYWNTPETPLFKKTETLYGIHLAKDAIRKENVAIVAEGQMDVIAFHQIGLTNTVASSGTALTDRQIKVLSRFCSELAFAFDADEAGQKAAERGFEIALSFDMNPSVIRLPQGSDPADLAKKNPEQLIQAYKARQPIITWLLSNAISKYGQASPQAKKNVTNAILPWVRRLTNPVERQSWLDLVAEKIGVNTRVLQEALTQTKAKQITPQPEDKQPAKTNNPDYLTILIGLLGLHPSLIDKTPYIERLVQDTPWLEILNYLKNNKEQNSQKITLPREQEIILNDAISLAEKEYQEADIHNLHTEAQNLAERARLDYNEKVKKTIFKDIEEAEKNGNQTAVNSLMNKLQSATIAKETAE